MNLGLVLCVTFSLGVVLVAAGGSYCDWKCQNGDVNVGCNNTWNMGPDCPDEASLYRLNQDDIKVALNLHNTDRNQTAAGLAPGKSGNLSAACRMPKITWSEQLANVSCFRAKTCKMVHDKCRSTDQFTYAGQNLAVISNYNDYASFSDAMKRVAFLWFNESRITTDDDINKFPSSPDGEIGHFTNMVDDRNTKVGCCASKYADGGLYKWLIACDYASDNLVGIPVYLTKPDCKNGIECKKYDTEYSSLCLDHVDPNDIYYKNN